MTENERIDFVKNCFETYYKITAEEAPFALKLSSKRAGGYGSQSGVPVEMESGEIDEGCVAWKLIPSRVTPSDMEAVQQYFGAAFPPLLKTFLTVYYHLFEDVNGVCNQPSDNPFQEIKEIYNPVLVKYGYLPFAWDAEHFYIRCIDLKNMPDENACGIYQIKDQILCGFDETTEQEEVKQHMQAIAIHLYDYLENVFLIKAIKISEEFKKRTAIPCMTLTAERKPVLPAGSKLGGKAYLPAGVLYPRDSQGKPLKLLAQLNFGDLPKLEHYPQKGLLQFFVRPDSVAGWDDQNITKQDGFRVLYHEEMPEDDSRCDEYEEIGGEWFPFKGEFALSGELGFCHMTSCDYRFNNEFMGVYKQSMHTKETSFFDLEDDFAECVYNKLALPGHRIGGYPNFTQEDPRECDKSLRRYDQLLFQIDTDGSGEDEIMWGDCGVANFFISLNNLQACDFTDVMYTWDCC